MLHVTKTCLIIVFPSSMLSQFCSIECMHGISVKPVFVCLERKKYSEWHECSYCIFLVTPSSCNLYHL